MKILIYFVFLNYIYSYYITEDEISKTIDDQVVTCGSILRIQNTMTKYYLHSHKLTWGSGSGQQSITAVQNNDDTNSLWIIKEEHTSRNPCETGAAVKCGDFIRLEHVNTGKNLHSHTFPSFVTDSQEASGFGENGYGDINDTFQILCLDTPDGQVLKGATKFQFYHKPTQSYLYIHFKKSLFNEHNCRGCPIIGQREVSLTRNTDMQCHWKIAGGILIKENSIIQMDD